MPSNTSFFSDLLGTIADRGRTLLGFSEPGAQTAARAAEIIRFCDSLLSGRGEASGVASADAVLRGYALLDRSGKAAFFHDLAKDFGPDLDRVESMVEAWRANPDEGAAADLHFFSEPKRQELFRRLNRAPGGTAALVRMREELLDLKREDTTLETVDRCLVHLFASWFNRGFLVLRRIDWSTPANILEKIIRYEAVHEIRDWDDLRRRIDPADRRCYAFFHPALVDEPLIFVEVALTDAIPDAIAPLLAETRALVRTDTARTAVFYSISNCQQGLAGISFGNFLIKQVVEELHRELRTVETFVTLSPAPGFMKWLMQQAATLTPDEQGVAGKLAEPDWAVDASAAEAMRKAGEGLAAEYFLQAKNANGRPLDPVARFHLGNGARLERINWLGDRSSKSLREGGGIMVNYLYDISDIEKNHEAYANQKVIAASNAVRRLQRGGSRARLQLSGGSSN